MCSSDLELHPYSSLNQDFIGQYKNSLDKANEAVVFYQPEPLVLKNRPPIPPEMIQAAFGRQDLKLMTTSQELESHIDALTHRPLVLLLMSSGNYGGLDLKRIFG